MDLSRLVRKSIFVDQQKKYLACAFMSKFAALLCAYFRNFSRQKSPRMSQFTPLIKQR